MKKPAGKRIITPKGSTLAVDNDPVDGVYVSWTVGSGYMYGMMENTAELRRFFRSTLRRLEADKRKKKYKGAGKVQTLKQTAASIRIHGYEHVPLAPTAPAVGEIPKGEYSGIRQNNLRINRSR